MDAVRIFLWRAKKIAAQVYALGVLNLMLGGRVG